MDVLDTSNPVCQVCSKINGFPVSHPFPINDGCPNKIILESNNKEEILKNRSLTSTIINVIDKLEGQQKEIFKKELGELLKKFSK